MTIFDYLKDITVTKKGTLALDAYVPFMTNRWLSFINPIVAENLNEFNTKSFVEDKELHYKIMIALFPKTKSVPKIEYIKKLKEEKKTEDSNLIAEEIMAANMELSKREIRQLLSELNELS